MRQNKLSHLRRKQGKYFVRKAAFLSFCLSGEFDHQTKEIEQVRMGGSVVMRN